MGNEMSGKMVGNGREVMRGEEERKGDEGKRDKKGSEAEGDEIRKLAPQFPKSCVRHRMRGLVFRITTCRAANVGTQLLQIKLRRSLDASQTRRVYVGQHVTTAEVYVDD